MSGIEQDTQQHNTEILRNTSNNTISNTGEAKDNTVDIIIKGSGNTEKIGNLKVKKPHAAKNWEGANSLYYVA